MLIETATHTYKKRCISNILSLGIVTFLSITCMHHMHVQVSRKHCPKCKKYYCYDNW